MALLCGAVGQWLHLVTQLADIWTWQWCMYHDSLNHTVELPTATLRTFGTKTPERFTFALLFCILCMMLLFLSGFAPLLLHSSVTLGAGTRAE